MLWPLFKLNRFQLKCANSSLLFLQSVFSSFRFLSSFGVRKGREVTEEIDELPMYFFLCKIARHCKIVMNPGCHFGISRTLERRQRSGASQIFVLGTRPEVLAWRAKNIGLSGSVVCGLRPGLQWSAGKWSVVIYYP